MFLRLFKVYSPDLELKINNTFDIFRDSLLKQYSKIWRTEDIEGDGTTKQWNDLQQLYVPLWLSILIYLHHINNPNSTWESIKNKYRLDEANIKLACANLDLDHYLKEFDYPFKYYNEGALDEGLGFMALTDKFQLDIAKSKLDNRFNIDLSLIREVIEEEDYDVDYIDCNNDLILPQKSISVLVKEVSRRYIVLEVNRNKILL